MQVVTQNDILSDGAARASLLGPPRRGVLARLMFLSLALLPLANYYVPLGSAELTPSEILVAMLLVSLSIRTILLSGVIRIPRPLRTMALCAAALALSSLASGFISGNLTTAIRLALSALFALFIAIACYRNGPRIWTTPVLIGVAASIAVAFGHLTGWVPLMAFERPSSGIATSGLFQIGYTGLVSARGEYGILLLLGIAAAMIGLTGTWKVAFLSGLLFAGLITISRSTWFALAAACSVMGLLFVLPGRTLTARLKNLMFYLMLVALLAAPASYLGLFDWVTEKFAFLVGLRVSSFDGRLEQFSYFFDTAGDYFWFGGGSGQFIQTFGYAIHNTQMGVYLAFGFLPAVLYGVLFLGALWRAMLGAAKLRNQRAKKQAGIILAVMCGCFIEASLYPKASSLIMWSLIGICWGHMAFLNRLADQSSETHATGINKDAAHYAHTERLD